MDEEMSTVPCALPGRDTYYRCPFCRHPYCAPWLMVHVFKAHPDHAGKWDYYEFIKVATPLPSLYEMFGHLFKKLPHD